jgi:hypothetical protein
MLCCNGLFKQPTEAGHTTIKILNQLSPTPAIHWICILYLETVLKHETGCVSHALMEQSYNHNLKKSNFLGFSFKKE